MPMRQPFSPGPRGPLAPQSAVLRFVLPVVLLAACLLAAPVRAQVHLGGSLDVEYRNGGRDASPLRSQTPATGGTFYVPYARLFAAADLAPRWMVQAALQTDYYGGDRLNPVFFSLLYARWQPFGSEALGLQAGRFVLPFGLEAERYLGFDNPFVHLPMLQEWNLRVDPEVGFFAGTPSYDAFPGQSVVYPRMYAQGVSVLGAAGPGERFTYALAATIASASSYVEAGYGPVPAVVGRVTARPSIWSRVGLSATYGPYGRRSDANDMLSTSQHARYRQAALAADVRLAYGHVEVAAQHTWNRWTTFWLDTTGEPVAGAPASTRGFHLLDDDVDLSLRHFMAEAKVDLPFLVGAYAALRYERMRFGRLQMAGGGRSRDEPHWMPETDRVEAVFGYRLARDVRFKASYLTASNGGPNEFDDDVLALQLSVRF